MRIAFLFLIACTAIAAQKTEEKVLFELPAGAEPDTRHAVTPAKFRFERFWLFYASPDRSRVAVPIRKGEKWVIAQTPSNGAEGTPVFPTKAFDEITYTGFSPDGRRTLVIAREGKTWHVAVDGVVGAPYEDIAQAMFTPDSKRVMYGGKVRDNLWQLVVDGKVQGEYRKVSYFRVNPASGRFVFFAQRPNERWAIVDNGTPGPEFDELWNPVFSTDGKRLAYGAKRQGKWVMIVDDKEVSPAYENLYGPLFSPDGSRFGFMVQADPKPAPKFRHVDEFSDLEGGKPAGDDRFYILKDDPTKKPAWFSLVVDGRESPVTAQITGPFFDRTGKNVLYVAGDHAEVSIYLNDKKLGTFRPDVPLDLGSAPSPIELRAVSASPDLSRVAILFQGRYPKRRLLTSFAYFVQGVIAEIGADGKVSFTIGPRHVGSGAGLWGMFSQHFSPDGKRFGYIALEEKAVDSRVVIDGIPGPVYDQIVLASFRVGNDSVSYVARRGNKIYKVTVSRE